MATSMIVIYYDITNGEALRRPWDGRMALQNKINDPVDWLGLYEFIDATDVTLPTGNDRQYFNKQRRITVMV